MQLILPDAVASKIVKALASAKHQEIGGVVVGEHLEDETFRITDVSIQTAYGTRTRFERDPVYHADFLAKFFERTGEEYTRFNYLGEWHSHPSFEPIPSRDDVTTMQSIVDDPAVGVNFAVLLIVRKDPQSKLLLSATVFSDLLAPRRIGVAGEAGPYQSKRRRRFAEAVRVLRKWLS